LMLNADPAPITAEDKQTSAGQAHQSGFTTSDLPARAT
jgi:hypothetical protein